MITPNKDQISIVELKKVIVLILEFGVTKILAIIGKNNEPPRHYPMRECFITCYIYKYKKYNIW